MRDKLVDDLKRKAYSKVDNEVLRADLAWALDFRERLTYRQATRKKVQTHDRPYEVLPEWTDCIDACNEIIEILKQKLRGRIDG